MEKVYDSGPAFPGEAQVLTGTKVVMSGIEYDGAVNRKYPGMSLRAYVATAALHGILACFKEIDGCEGAASRAKMAVKHADALLAELSKPAP